MGDLIQTQLWRLQDALAKLGKENYTPLSDSSTVNILPAAIILLSGGDNHQAVDSLFFQVFKASRKDINLRQTATTCFINMARALAFTQDQETQSLRKIVPYLHTITENTEYTEQTRTDAKAVLDDLKSLQSGGVKLARQQPPTPKNSLSTREEKIFQLAAAGNTEKAREQLFDMIVTCAQEKDFENAERLRERFYEIDPMALKEIIKSGAIIEQEKQESISEDKLKIWARLRQTLNDGEFNNLYCAMDERTFEPEETIVAQGAKNDELYFINFGNVRMSHLSGNKEFFLNNLEAGDIAGENFFNPSVWTVSLTAMEFTRILVLKRDKLAELVQNNPGIEPKLRDYYKLTADIHKMLMSQRMDRRIHVRVKLTCPLNVEIVDDRDRILSSFSGELADISLRGLSFIARIRRKENCRLLLGRNMKISIPIKGMRETVHLRGIIMGIQPYDMIANDYSIHVKLDKEFDSRSLQGILGEYHVQISS